MPRGDSPNSRKNLTHPGFNTETARIAKKKSEAAHKLNSSIRSCLKDELTDEELRKMCKAIIKRAQAGNITAFKTIFDVSGEGQSESDASAEVTLAILAPVLPREEPPNE